MQHFSVNYIPVFNWGVSFYLTVLTLSTPQENAAVRLLRDN